MAKTNPTGVRIKKDKLDFIKETEGLTTVQQVVTFLVDKYWWEKKLNNNPILVLGEEKTKK